MAAVATRGMARTWSSHFDHLLFTTTYGCGDDGTFASLVHVLP
jgi:hypothetical protein